MGKQVIEAGHPVGLGRRHLEFSTRVVQPTGADPARRPLQGVQGRQKQVATFPGTGPAGVDEPLSLTDGDRPESSDGRSHRCPLSLGGLLGRPEVKVRHGLRPACRSGWPPP